MIRAGFAVANAKLCAFELVAKVLVNFRARRALDLELFFDDADDLGIDRRPKLLVLIGELGGRPNCLTRKLRLRARKIGRLRFPNVGI